MMGRIKRYHLVRAAKQSLWLYPVFAVFGAVTVIIRDGTFVDFLWGMAAPTVLVPALFLYYLWRTQRDPAD